MAVETSEQLDKIVRKLDQLLRRKRTLDYMQRKRQETQKDHRIFTLNQKIQQLEVEKISLLAYIRELEKFNNLPTQDDL